MPASLACTGLSLLDEEEKTHPLLANRPSWDERNRLRARLGEHAEKHLRRRAHHFKLRREEVPLHIRRRFLAVREKLDHCLIAVWEVGVARNSVARPDLRVGTRRHLQNLIRALDAWSKADRLTLTPLWSPYNPIDEMVISTRRLAQQELAILERQMLGGKPSNIQLDTQIAFLAAAWCELVGEHPAQSRSEGQDQGEFADWARLAFQILSPGTHLVGKAPIAQALRRIEEGSSPGSVLGLERKLRGKGGAQGSIMRASYLPTRPSIGTIRRILG